MLPVAFMIHLAGAVLLLCAGLIIVKSYIWIQNNDFTYIVWRERSVWHTACFFLLILRQISLSCTSKDEAPACRPLFPPG
jgi:hypothetical protein